MPRENIHYTAEEIEERKKAFHAIISSILKYAELHPQVNAVEEMALAELVGENEAERFCHHIGEAARWLKWMEKTVRLRI